MYSTSTLSSNWVVSPEGLAVLLALGLAFALLALCIRGKSWASRGVAPHYGDPRVTGVVTEILGAKGDKNDLCYLVKVPQNGYAYFLDYNDCDRQVYKQLRRARVGDEVTLDIYGDPEMGMHFENLTLNPR